MIGFCYDCKICDGRACKNTIPGPGAKGIGEGAIDNYRAWKNIKINMDTLGEHFEPDTSFDFFGSRLKLPLIAAPVGAVKLHYGEKHTDESYNEILLGAAKKAGIIAFAGDGTDPHVIKGACEALKGMDGFGVPTIKPWDNATCMEKIDMALESGAKAISMDVDAAGLPFLQGLTPPAGRKSVEELREIIEHISRANSNIPFIVKGIMTPSGAIKAVKAGARAIVISNHGGRVLDQCPPTAHVLPAIVKAVRAYELDMWKSNMAEQRIAESNFSDEHVRMGMDPTNIFKVNVPGEENGIFKVNVKRSGSIYTADASDKVKIFVDGGIRDGIDVFKALALGADGVLVARPFVNAVYNHGENGVLNLVDKFYRELKDTMLMCGAKDLKSIGMEQIFV